MENSLRISPYDLMFKRLGLIAAMNFYSENKISNNINSILLFDLHNRYEITVVILSE